jgi:hypothetical protein
MLSEADDRGRHDHFLEHARDARAHAGSGRPVSSTGPEPLTPPVHEPRSGWCWVADEWRGLRVGQTVLVPVTSRRAQVFEIWSHRLGGGVVCTLQFEDRTCVIRRAADVLRHSASDVASEQGDAR